MKRFYLVTLCHKKSYDHTCSNILACTCNVIDNMSTMLFLIETMFILKVTQPDCNAYTPGHFIWNL